MSWLGMRCRVALAVAVGVTACGPTGTGTATGTAAGTGTATAPATTPAAAPAGDAEAMIELHNKFRAQHCAPPLVWADDLAAVAQKWADTLDARGCAFEHSRTHFGENLAAGTGQHLKPRTVVEMWYREVNQYEFRRGAFDMRTGHFTQLVWVGTRRLGCGRRRCGTGMDIVVCNYDPPGNVETLFERNVLPATCKKEGR